MIKKSFFLNEIPTFLLLHHPTVAAQQSQHNECIPGKQVFGTLFCLVSLNCWIYKHFTSKIKKISGITVKVLRVGMISCKMNVHSYPLSWHPFRSVHEKMFVKNISSENVSGFCIQFKIQIGWMCHYPLVLVVIIIVIPPFHLRLSFLHFQLLFCVQTTTAERRKIRKKLL